MKRILIALLGSMLLASSLVAVSPSSATAATTASPAIKKLAKKMRCKFGSPDGLYANDNNPVVKGWECVVGAGTRDRRTYYIMRYRNTPAAIDHWRDWISCYGEDYETGEPCEPGYIAAKGGVLIVAQNSRDSYGFKYANYAAGRTDGRVIAGYRY